MPSSTARVYILSHHKMTADVRKKPAINHQPPSASGGSSIYRDVPIQRIQRDIETLNLHGIMHPATNLELYGRIVCGLDSNTPYI